MSSLASNQPPNKHAQTERENQVDSKASVVYIDEKIKREVPDAIQGMTIDQVVKNIDRLRIGHAVQPIIATQNSSVYGYETFSRLFYNNYQIPVGVEELLQSGLDKDILHKLDKKLMDSAMNVSLPRMDAYRFINVSSETNFMNLVVDNFNGQPGRYVIELTEHFPINHWDQVSTKAKEIRSWGVKIAIDDFGAGHGNYQMLFELKPDFVKLDKFFTRHATEGNVEQHRITLKNLVETIHSTGAAVVIEGVETFEQLDFFLSIGVDYCQGFYLGRPALVGMVR